MSERLSEGVMAEAFPFELVGPVKQFDLLADPYENSEHFGNGLKVSPFNLAGVMQDGHVLTAKVTASYNGEYATLGDVLVSDEEVPGSYYVEDDKLDAWRYLKGRKSEPRVNKKTGFEYRYSEGAMAFPDAIDAPARTILTNEGGGSASRTKHIIRASNGRYRRLVPDELDQLQGFPKGWTDTGMTDGNRAFCMGNALIVGIPHRIGQAIARRLG